MKRRFHLYLTVFLFFITCLSQADSLTDSLYKIIRGKIHDTIRIDVYNELCWPVYTVANPDSALKYGNLALNLATKMGDAKRMAIASRRIGIAYMNLANHQQALFYQNKSYEICKKIGWKKGMASSLNNIGVVYLNISDLKRAIDFSLRAQKLQEELKDSTILFESYYNTGLLFKDIKEYDKALQFYKKSYDVASIQKSYEKMGFALAGIGTVVKKTIGYDTALAAYEKALGYFEKENNTQGLTEVYVNMGSLSSERKDIDTVKGLTKSLYYYFKALNYNISHKNFLIRSNILGNIAFSYSRLGKYDSAIYYSKKAMELAAESNNQGELVFIYGILSTTYQKTGDYKQSLTYLHKHMSLKEILYNEEKQREIVLKQLQYDFDKKLLADSLQKIEEQKSNLTKIELANTKLKHEKILRYSLIAGIIFIVVFLFFLYNRFKATKEQNTIIEEQKRQVVAQKDIIEIKQKEIVASINYAKRIQDTLLVKDNELITHLKEHFVLFKPKDIVSGDFYWSTVVQRSNSNAQRFYLACCDCTGHGVPGAFMSLLNMGFLTEAINEKNIIEPNKVFDYVRKRLIESISGDGGQDGMDGILICVDENSDTITYAAANNSPVIIRGNEYVHLPADKMPVGLGVRKDNFKLYSFKKSEASHIFLYTDGYADQFGGPKGKKFKYRQLDELLLSIKNNSATNQQKTLDTTFEEWRGNLEQVDDVCIIGVKL
ncbi:MAG: protein serine/threonine phosphatase [Bacteroidetes bacterium]|jgi:serine phosphatase RsbU (regulator of sigma subunit)|nr:protein serine/threonine phosphatase [Bacteroidota bacterium]